MEQEHVEIEEIITEFVKQFNEKYKFALLKSKKEILYSYDPKFFEEIETRQKVPLISSCYWIVYLIIKFLNKQNISHKILILKYKEIDGLMIHVVLKIEYNGKLFFIDTIRNTLFISSNYDNIASDPRRGIKHIDFIELNDKEMYPKNFNDILKTNEFFKGWDANNLVERLTQDYENLKIDMTNIKLELKNNLK